MPTENPTTTIEVKFRGDGGPASYTGTERRDESRDKGRNHLLCEWRVLVEMKQPTLMALADERSFALKFNRQPPDAEGDSTDFRREVVDRACREMSESVKAALLEAHLDAISAS